MEKNLSQSETLKTYFCEINVFSKYFSSLFAGNHYGYLKEGFSGEKDHLAIAHLKY